MIIKRNLNPHSILYIVVFIIEKLINACDSIIKTIMEFGFYPISILKGDGFSPTSLEKLLTLVFWCI